MARDFRVNGDCLVRVRFGAHVSGSITVTVPDVGTQSAVSASGYGPQVFELGLAAGPVVVSPRLFHQDVRCDDFGPDAPADVLAMLAEARLSMTLVHYDHDVLDRCLTEAMGGGEPGTLAPAGTPLGGLAKPGASGWHYVSVHLASPVLGRPWRFLNCHMDGQPAAVPLGVEKSAARVEFRAVPYWYDDFTLGSAASALPGEILSSGRVLWDRRAPDA